MPGGLVLWYSGSLLGEAIGEFPYPAACIAPCSTVKAGWQGGRFQVGPALVSLCLCKMCAFSNRILPFSYGGQTKAMSITHVDLGVSGASLTSNSQKEPKT